MDASEAARLRQMEDENRRLKQLVADRSPDKENSGAGRWECRINADRCPATGRLLGTA
jgi:hypothetical protein